MNEPSFKEQFLAVDKILQELLRTEFKDLREPVRLLVGKISGDAIAETYPYGTVGRERVIILSINNWADNVSKHYAHGGLSYDSIREDLRHELLHLQTKRGCEDPAFINEAGERGIGLKGSIDRHPPYHQAEAVNRVIAQDRKETIENLRTKQESIMEQDPQYTKIDIIKGQRGDVYFSGRPRKLEDGRYSVPKGSFVFDKDTNSTREISGEYSKRSEFLSRVKELIGTIKY